MYPIRESSPKETNPHGARSRKSSGTRASQVFFHHGDGLIRMTHVRAVSGCLHVPERAARKVLLEELADALRRHNVVAALQDERGSLHSREILAIVRIKRRLGESARDHRIGGAKTRDELLAKLGALRILHDGGREEVRPPNEVLVHHLEQTVDVGTLKAADVVPFIDVPRRWPNENQLSETVRLAVRRED